MNTKGFSTEGRIQTVIAMCKTYADHKADQANAYTDHKMTQHVKENTLRGWFFGLAFLAVCTVMNVLVALTLIIFVQGHGLSV